MGNNCDGTGKKWKKLKWLKKKEMGESRLKRE
jgi:hypothetical protein